MTKPRITKPMLRDDLQAYHVWEIVLNNVSRTVYGWKHACETARDWDLLEKNRA